jgi:HAT1-interacting factor 1
MPGIKHYCDQVAGNTHIATLYLQSIFQESSPSSIMAESNEPVPTSADLAAKLDTLKAQATQQYSLKNYSAAAELYSEAAEVQDEINGEMSPENAELLYHYGRCLYHVAVQNSDVLGGKVASSEEPKRKKRKVVKSEEGNGEGSSSTAAGSSSLIGDAIKSGEASLPSEKPTTDATSKPFFQITGDENWTDSEDDGEGDDADAGAGEGGEEEEGDDDDFAVAYEILDMARVLLARRIEAVRSASGSASEIRQLEERLADTHDLQAEISLENERFADAINDTRDALTLKLHLYPRESSLVAEAHFKLSLALEFASVTSIEPSADDDPNSAPTGVVDEKMRAEAASEMEKAIESCTLRMEKESATLPSLTPEKAADLRKNLVDIKEMITDMKQRLVDLRGPATSLSGLNQASFSGGANDLDGDAIRGVLGALLGESKSGQKKILEEATQNAHDLTGLVKKKKPAAAPAAESTEASYEGKGKRKADDGQAQDQDQAQGAPARANGSGKRVKFEEDLKEE